MQFLTHLCQVSLEDVQKTALLQEEDGERKLSNIGKTVSLERGCNDKGNITNATCCSQFFMDFQNFIYLFFLCHQLVL